MGLFDIMGRVMIGPSSSHTAGVARLGRLVRRLAGQEIKEAVLHLHGSFAATYRGHGTDKALVHHLLPASCLLMGIMTGVGGGMLRDVFLGEVPRIFQRSNLYAVCALAGSAAYYAAVMFLSVSKLWASLLCIAVTMGLRRWSLRFNVQTPADVDLGPKVSAPVRRAVRLVRVTRRRSKRR